MILFEEALQIVLSQAYEFGTEYVDIKQAPGRILATDVISDLNMPPFDKSAMDGYACKKEDITNELEVIETIRAGSVPRETIRKNQCAKIMTGGMLPEGADCVIVVENVEELPGNKIRYKKTNTGLNICYLGEDVKKGNIVLKKGTLLKPQHIAILASVGVDKPEVFKKPLVTILSTGSELVEPASKPGISQIRNSNGYQLFGQALTVGVSANYGGIVLDTKQETYAKISNALTNSDILILTGGVSMGEFDFVPEILQQLKANVYFKKVAVQPGKPVVFAQIRDKFIFALPGNPVSSFTSFELFVKPFLFKLMGHNYKPLVIKLPFGSNFKRKKVDRKKWIPVVINEKNIVMPLEYHGSAHIYSFEKAIGIININIGKAEIKKGELVDVRQI
ncbi:MAG: molybdopterin molybdotransferase MoeA [Chlorobi bacterium]|nr:molybdopterin molybdotransferase MoeA [Chlorobiota bacterium]